MATVPRPKSKKFAALDKREQRRRIAAGVAKGRMTAEQGEKAARHWKLGTIMDRPSGGVPSLGRVVGGLFDRDDDGPSASQSTLRDWQRPKYTPQEKKSQAIKRYTPPPRPLSSLARLPQYEEIFGKDEGVVRAAETDEKLSGPKLLKKYGSFQKAAEAKTRAEAVRQIERKLAKHEAVYRWEQEALGQKAAETPKGWDIPGRLTVAGVNKIPGFSEEWKSDARTLVAGTIPGALELGQAVGTDLFVRPVKMIAGTQDDPSLATWKEIIKPTIQQYAEAYGKGVTRDPSTWANIGSNIQQRSQEHPLFTLLDASIAAGPVARAAGIGKMALKGMPGEEGRVGLRRAAQESFRPGKFGIITPTLETRSGVQIPKPNVSRHPFGRTIEKGRDILGAPSLFGRPNVIKVPGRKRDIEVASLPGIGQWRRASKLEAKTDGHHLRRLAIEANVTMKDVADFTGSDPSLLDQVKTTLKGDKDEKLADVGARETTLFHAAQGPADSPLGMINATIAAMKDMHANPESWDLPEKADTATLQRLDKEIVKLEEKRDAALKKEGESAQERAVQDDHVDIRRTRGKLQALKVAAMRHPEGSPERAAADAEVTEMHSTLVNKQATLALKRGQFVQAVTGSPERDTLLAAMHEIGADHMIKAYDAVARQVSPDNPALWYRERIGNVKLEDAKTMLRSLNQKSALFHIPGFHLRAAEVLAQMDDPTRKRSWMEIKNHLMGQPIKKPEIVGLIALVDDMRSQGTKSMSPDDVRDKLADYVEIPDEKVLDGERYPEYTLGGDRSSPQTFLWYLDSDKHGVLYEQKAAHYGDEIPHNLIAWVRTNIRTTKDGRRILMIEEFQSDWIASSRAKKQAWADLQQASTELSAAQARHTRLEDAAPRRPANMSAQDRAVMGDKWVAVDDAWKEVRRLATEYTSAKRAWEAEQDTQPGPYMETDQYMTLAIDRLMKEAAEQGLDGIAWTTGNQQRARWNKAASDDIERVTWKPKKQEIHVIGRTSVSPKIHPNVATFRDLKAVMGEVQAKRFWDRHMADPDYDVTFPGEEIEVGARIHDFIYDEVAPRVIGAAGKKHGQDVGKVEIFGEADYEVNAIRDAYEEATGDYFPIVIEQDMYGQWVLMDGRFTDEPWTGYHGGQEPIITGELSMIRPHFEREAKEFYDTEFSKGRTGWSDETVNKAREILRKGNPEATTTESVHFLPLPKSIHKGVKKQEFTYFRHQIPGEELPRGATEFLRDKTTRLRLSNLANEETLAHELWHIGFHDMTEADKQALAVRRKKSSFNQLDEADHEALANEWIEWWKTGKAPNKDLETVFFKFRQWLRQIYGAMKGIDEFDPETEAIFQRMLGYEGMDVADRQAMRIGGLGPVMPESERLGVLLRDTREKREKAEGRMTSARAAQELPALQKRVGKEIERAMEAESEGDHVSATRHWNEAANLTYRITIRKYQTVERQANRRGLLAKQIEDMERVLTDLQADDAQLSTALDSIDHVMGMREQMLDEVFPDSKPIREERKQLLVNNLKEKGFLDEDAAPARTALQHRALHYWQTMADNIDKQIKIRGQSKRYGTVSAPSRTDLQLHLQNQLIRWQSGDLLADPAVALDSMQTALAYYASFQARRHLFREGDVVAVNAHKTGSLNDGWILVKDPDNPTEIPKSMREWQLLTPEQKRATLLNESYEGTTDPAVVEQEVAAYNREWMSEPITNGTIDPEMFPQFFDQDGMLVPGVRQVPQWQVDAYLPDPSLGSKKANRAGLFLDNATALARFALLSTNPGYIPSNIAGNLIFLFSTAGVELIPAMKDYARLLKSKNGNSRMAFGLIKGEIGTGRMASTSMRSQVLGQQQRKVKGVVDWNRLPEANVSINEKYLGPIADDPWRMWAWIEEARRRGYKNEEQWLSLLRADPDSKMGRDREIIRAGANSRMVDFDRLTPTERATLGRWVFVYPWLRGATAWAGWYAKNFPERLGAMGIMSQSYMERSGSGDMELPPYLDLLAKSPFGGGNLINTASVSPLATAYDMYKIAYGIPKGDVHATEVPSTLLSPPIQALMQAGTRRGTFGQTLKWEDIWKDAAGSMIPGASIYYGMTNPTGISDIYENPNRKDILLYKTLRFIPRKYNEPYLKALADRSKTAGKEFRADQYKEMNSIAAAAEKQGSEAFAAVPTNVRKAYDFHVEMHERVEALKEAITKQGDFKRTRVGQANLTPKQELGVLLSVIDDVYPEFAGDEGMPTADEVAGSLTEEQMESAIRKLKARFTESRYKWRAVAKALDVKTSGD